MNRRRQPAGLDQRGTIAVITAMCLLLLLGMTGLALDLGHLYVVKSELQRAADAGAEAGARALFFPATSAPPQCSQATATGTMIAQANRVNGAAAAVADIQTGYWDWHAGTFAAGCSSASPNYTTAVKLTARNPVNLAFMGIFGHAQVTLSAPAISSMAFVRGVPPGTIPVALSKSAYKIGNQVIISFTGTDNGGWFVPTGYSSSASALVSYIEATAPLPALTVGESVNLNNGVVSSALSALATQLAAHSGSWTTFLPAVDTNSFNQSFPIYGFAAFTLTQVKTGNNASITGTISQLQEAPGPGYSPGGPPLNILAPVKLVN